MGRNKRAAALACLVLAACASPPTPPAAPSGSAKPAATQTPPAQGALIGMSKAEVIACAGEPWRSGTHEGREYLIYMNADARAADVQALQTARPPAAGAKPLPRYCRVTFVLKDGIVEKLELAGYATGPLVQSKECAEITGPCLKK